MDIRHLQCFTHIRWNPSRRDLRTFGVTMLVGFAVLGAIAAFRSGGVTGTAKTLWALGAALALTSVIPGVGRAAYFLVNLPAAIIGFCMSRVALAIMFFLVVTPVGAILRVFGKDLLQRKPASGGWVALDSNNEASRYYQQF